MELSPTVYSLTSIRYGGEDRRKEATPPLVLIQFTYDIYDLNCEVWPGPPEFPESDGVAVSNTRRTMALLGVSTSHDERSRGKLDDDSLESFTCLCWENPMNSYIEVASVMIYKDPQEPTYRSTQASLAAVSAAWVRVAIDL